MKIYWYTKILPVLPEITHRFISHQLVDVSVIGNKVLWEGVLRPRLSPGLNPGVTIPGDAIVVEQWNKITLEVVEDDSSYRYRALMQKPSLVLKFSLPYFVEIPVGAYCIFQNQKFTLNSPENIKKQGSRNIEYTITMGTLEDNLSMYKMRNSVDRRLKWSMCAKPHEFIEEIVKNLNERDGADVWSVGDCIDANEKTIEFNHTYLDAALSSVASAFETEYEISEDYVISLHKVEYFKDDPLALAYGRGNGFIPGVGRTTQLEDLPIKRLYLQGTERNIDRSKYGGWDSELEQFTTPFPYKTTSAELRLPPNQSLRYDGSHFEDEEGFVENAAHTYTTDEDGYYIERTDKVSKAVKEDSLDCSEIYPSFVGRVDSVQLGSESNAEEKHFDIIDSSIPETLNFKDYVIAGENMTIIFQSGMLAGKEFECKYRHRDNQNNLERRWEIVPQDIDGETMPGGVFMPAEGDTYAVFGIMPPNEYICDNANKSGASWKMFREGCRKLYEREEQKFTFTGELQGLWAKQNWLNVGGHLKIGGYVLFTDEQFAPDGELIRIVGVKDYLTSPYSPTIEIANSVSGGGSSVSANLQKIETTEVVISETEKRMKQFTKRRFRDALETISALDEALLENFSHSINPVAVQTMSALVGDESLQFQFVEFQLITQENTPPTYLYTKIDDPVGYDSESKILSIPQCYIQHLTLGVTSIESNRDPSHGVGYKQWRMAQFDSPTLTADFGRLYLYAKVPVSTTPPPLPNGVMDGGEFKLETTAHSLREGDYYWLLVGILSSECDGERSYVSMYGFTEITPGRITTDKVISADGESYFDLANSVMKLGDCLIYNLNGDNTLHLKFLTSENSNLGGWIFRDNLLISQKGSVGGNEAEYNDIAPDGRFPGGVFIPNISLDAVNGKIMQAGNLVIDDDGISLLNERGEVAAHITNNTIGDIGDLANAADTRTGRVSLSNQPQYLPYGGSSYRQTISVGIINVGFLSDGSTITHNNSRLEFKVPSVNDSQTGGDLVRCVFAQMQVDLYRGNTKVSSLGSAVMTTSHDAGQTVVLSSASPRTITIGGNIPEGNYTIRMTLIYDLLGQHGATLTNLNVSGEVNYSFAKYGFQRTVLGNDGFYTSWAQNQYIFANSQGITLRHGDAVIKLSGNGLQKSTNGGDTFTAL